MITGHRHRKNAQAKDDLLSISLWDWWHDNKTPSCALHIQDGGKDKWIIVEYVRYDDIFDPNLQTEWEKGKGHWRILKEFIFEEKENKWKESFKTSLKTLNEQELEKWKGWNDYEIEWNEKKKKDNI
jgi:hypothetical protein